MSAAACVDDETGTIYYLLSEQTAESNVHPRRPHWSARFFGTASECLGSIVRWSSGCEGGCTKGGNGRDMTPTGYIGKWREAMSNPVRLPKGEVRAKFGTGFYDVSPELRDVVLATLSRYGVSGVDGIDLRIDMNAPKALPAIVELLKVGNEKGLYPWRLWSYVDSMTARWPGLGVPATTVKGAKATGVRVWRIKQANDDEFLIAFGDDAPRMSGWNYSVIQNYICRAVVPAEMEQPGVTESMIRSFRKLVEDAPVVGSSAGVVLKMPSGIEVPAYQKRDFDELRKKLGRQDDSVIRTTLGQIDAIGGIWALRQLDDSMVEFELGNDPVTLQDESAQGSLMLC